MTIGMRIYVCTLPLFFVCLLLTKVEPWSNVEKNRALQQNIIGVWNCWWLPVDHSLWYNGYLYLSHYWGNVDYIFKVVFKNWTSILLLVKLSDMNIHDQSLILDGIYHLLLVLKGEYAHGDNYCTNYHCIRGMKNLLWRELIDSFIMQWHCQVGNKIMVFFSIWLGTQVLRQSSIECSTNFLKSGHFVTQSDQ